MYIYRQKWAAVPTSVDDNQSTVPRNRTHADVSYSYIINGLQCNLDYLDPFGLKADPGILDK